MAGTETRIVIQPRDLALLREFAVTRVMDRMQAMNLGRFGSVTRVNARLLALVRSGLLRRFFLGSGGGRKALYSLSPKGAQLVDAPIRGLRRRQNEMLVADFSVLHQLAINQIYCALKCGKSADGVFRRWTAFYEPVAQNLALIPDGYVELNSSRGIVASFLEVDLGHESLKVWKEKTQHYLELALSGEFEKRFSQPRFRVLVLANSSRRLQSIRAAVAGITGKIFWFATLEAAERDFFSGIWLRPAGHTPQTFFEVTP